MNEFEATQYGAAKRVGGMPQSTVPVQREDVEDSIDLVQLFYMYLEHIWQILLVMILGAALAFGYTRFMVTPMYRATTMIYVVSASNDSLINLSDLQLGSQLKSDYEKLITIHPLIEDVIENLQLNMSYGQLVSMISVSSPSDSRLLYITARSPSPTQAAEIANEVARQTIAYLPEIMASAAPNIADSATVPGAPFSPNYSSNMVKGAALTTLLYCAILLIQFMANDSFTGPDDISRVLGELPLATIPEGNLGETHRKGKKHREKKDKKQSKAKRGQAS